MKVKITDVLSTDRVWPESSYLGNSAGADCNLPRCWGIISGQDVPPHFRKDILNCPSLRIHDPLPFLSKTLQLTVQKVASWVFWIWPRNGKDGRAPSQCCRVSQNSCLSSNGASNRLRWQRVSQDSLPFIFPIHWDRAKGRCNQAGQRGGGSPNTVKGAGCPRDLLLGGKCSVSGGAAPFFPFC